MDAMWIGYDEAEQLREVLQGIAADEHAPERVRARSLAAAPIVGPQIGRDDLEAVAVLLEAAADSELDPTWRDSAGYWHRQVQHWLRPEGGHPGY
jgi:hypothetical protein